ncbi:unnamed protein product [Menidia menidia]|uniref:(Atlantic silverside) hypothetical protein n=1 Tax=Menidia menidia TaxID=238744 RepID=A0A8S4BSA1_9TELE|nr:unnamed protein product [Menidia menidia]
MQADGEMLALSGGTQTLHGVEISRDRTGVAAKMAAANHSVTVLFDGLTSAIHITATSESPAGGWKSQQLLAFLAPQKQERGGQKEEMKRKNNPNSPIQDGSQATPLCGRLLEAPFSFCHRDVDPHPFLQACTQTQCHLPPAGGAGCPLLEAYAQTCRLLSNISLEGWRPAAGCSPGPQDGCMDKVCSHHEFCGVDRVTGETRCLCRAIFASQYQPSNSFGEPTVCGKKSASVTFANCLLENKGIDYSLLHLNDRSCKGELDNVTHMVTFGFDGDNSCGTVIQANSSHLIFRNTIKSGNISSPGGISRHGEVSMDFSCFHSQPEVESLAIKLRHRCVANSSHLIFRNTIKSGNVSSPGGISRHGEVSMDFSCFHSQPEVESLAIKLRHRCVVSTGLA